MALEQIFWGEGRARNLFGGANILQNFEHIYEYMNI